ncbi:hypothetical protein QQ045_033570 [Rhodiola kirilowii]
MVGHPFTFSNRREGDAEVKARLDRAFPRAAVSHCHFHASDHQLIVLDTRKKCTMKKKRLFRFEAMWLDHPEFPNVMRELWDNAENGVRSWAAKLKDCTETLILWNMSSFGNVQKRIKKLKVELEEVKRSVRSVDMIKKERSLTEELDYWLAREETMWLQRSRVLWMQQRDKNTKFFHVRASHRRKKNWIEKLKDNQGQLHEEEAEIMNITDYFARMFQSTISEQSVEVDRELEKVFPRINMKMNKILLKEISEEEVRHAVFSLDPLKALGIDNFPILFYQKYWDRAKEKECSQDGILAAISLCTVAVKIIIKIIASRLQPFLDDAISPFQNEFLKGRIITDTSVVAHELAHFTKSCKSQKIVVFREALTKVGLRGEVEG